MTTLSAVWQQVEALLADGISLIPVRDKEEWKADKLRLPKTPIGEWKHWQSEIIGKEELFHKLEQANSNAVGIVCGKVSGNLEVIDVDVKWKPGIDSHLFTDIKQLYPDLLAKLRIHKSPSGGCHILYRVSPNANAVPGNQKLAKRPSTDDELAANPKEKTKCFLETRGEGGYVVAPPSLGYTVRVDNPIPVITWEERCSLITLCKCYDELPVLEVRPVKTSQYDNSYYDENPFEHFNRSAEGECVLSDNGWKLDGAAGDYVHFTRPGKDNGVSASWIKSRRLFRIFTSNSEFENEKAYNPSTALSILLHGGDKKKTYQHLVAKGYGIIKPATEEHIVKRAAAVKKALPPNASEQARQAYADAVIELAATLPHGPFWKYDEDSCLYISRESFLHISAEIGFFIYNQSVVRQQGRFLHKRTDRYFFDALKQYITDDDGDTYELICNCYELFVQKSGTFMISRLPLLDDGRLISDTPAACYKFYQNGLLTITVNSFDLSPYDELPPGQLIWHESVQPRIFTLSPDPTTSRYLQFLALATNSEDLYMQRAIGYLAHEYKDETTGYIIVLTEECPDPKQGGGSGKNIFSALLAYTTTFKNIPGAQVRFDERFLQAWDGQRILAVSDVPKHFDFLFLKELSTGSGIQKKLFKDEVAIPCARMPKFIIQTNYSYEVSDGGLRRRIIPIEFTDFFTKNGGVDIHFDAHFPAGWTDEDWAGYDTYIAQCVQAFLLHNRKLAPLPLSTGGWRKQYEQEFGQLTYQFIDENWEGWVGKSVKVADFNLSYTAFCNDNNVDKKFRLSSIKMNRALEEYAKHNDTIFAGNEHQKENGIMHKVKRFLPKSPF